MISFICPGCRRTLAVKDEFAGKAVACPHCKRRLTAPAAAAGPERPAFLAPPQGPGELGRLGPYRVLRVLGSGGMGLVLQAEDPMLKRSVALKVMRPELAAKPDARQRFLREAQATAAIEHPNIVAIYQVGEDRGVPFLAMPFLKGEALDARLQRARSGDGASPLTVAEVVHLGRQIAEGLAAAHRNGLIHRDIKPANVWLERQEGDAGAPGWVKILDFGLARAVADDDGHLTKPGAILGTPAYMAPEQARGGKIDHRCDLFSLGAVLYRMLTGEAPFKGNDPLALIAALALDTPRPVRELNPRTPPPLADLVMRLLAKDPADRPPTARAVADALAAMEQDRTQVLESGPHSVASAPRAGKRRRWLLPTAGGALLLGLTAAVLIFFLRPAPPPSRGEAPADGPPAPAKEILNSIGMKLLRIEPGKFVMGSPTDEAGRKDDEAAHEVTLTRPFYLGACKVTVGQFQAFVNETHYQTLAEKGREGASIPLPDGKWALDPKLTWRTPGFEQGVEQPVVCVAWDDALAFCLWLSKKEGRPYGLPTEAQWEYACRAGATTKFPFGDDGREANDYAWLAPDAQKRTHPVGQKKPNAWGFYDMAGNAWEFTADWYAKDYYPLSPPRDPPGPAGPGAVVERGAEWADGAFVARGVGFSGHEAACRAAVRIPSTVRNRNASLGFRVALLPEQTTTNSIGMKLAWIPAGTFTMGSKSGGGPGRKDDETPQHEVTITNPFYLGVYKATVGQFKDFVGETKYQTEAERNGAGSSVYSPAGWTVDPKLNWQRPGYEQTDDEPVVCVSWNDAVAFCAWLSQREGRRYALPTEAQWEYACRAGSGGLISGADAAAQLRDDAWYRENSEGKIHPVGRKRPNAWGLFDTRGLAWEWAADWYDKDYYKTSPREDPPGPAAGELRVQRGCGAISPGVDCRAALRNWSAPSKRTAFVGFRVVLLP